MLKKFVSPVCVVLAEETNGKSVGVQGAYRNKNDAYNQCDRFKDDPEMSMAIWEYDRGLMIWMKVYQWPFTKQEVMIKD